MTLDDMPKSHLVYLEQDTITAKYQSLDHFLWLTSARHPYLCIATSLLAQYNKQPSMDHYDTATYVLRFIRGTSYHGITFSSKTNKNLENFVDVNIADQTLFSM
jgi:hypothetical protein